MIDYVTYLLYKAVIKCVLFEFTIDGRTCNAQFFHNTRNRDTAAFNGFLQDFALVWHNWCIA